MTAGITSILGEIKEFFSPTVRENRTPETDENVNRYAPQRIKRSPGYMNLSELNEEPEWYHDV